MWLTACLCLALSVWAWLWLQGARLRAMASKIPGQTAYPIVGNALQIGTSTCDFFKYLQHNAKKFSWRPFTVWVGHKLYVIISNPKDLEIVLGSNTLLEKGDIYDFFLPWLGTGLLTSTGDKWRKHRKILTPSFHFKILENNIDVFNANCKILVEKLKTQVDGPGFDVHKYITLCALDNICESAMGVKINAQEDSGSDYVNAVRNLSEIIMKRSFQPWYGVDFIFNLTPYKKINDESLHILHTTTNSVIKSRRAEIELEKKLQRTAVSKEDVNQSDGVKKRLAFLDLLIESTYNGSLLTDENIREEVDTFMFEGHDTTSSGIGFTLWLLSQHQDVQEKVYQELQQVFPDEEASLTFLGLQELKYLERVIKESLRLYPSVPIYARRIPEDLELTDGLVVPKGATVTIAAFMAHRHPDFTPDPDTFNPDRFEADNAQGRHPYAFVPFSAGPRNCIGQKFAMLELKATIVHVIKNYRLLPGTLKPDLQLALDVILISTTGIKIKIVPR